MRQPRPNGERRNLIKIFGSESVVRRMIRLGEMVLIREQGPGLRRARWNAQTTGVWHRLRLSSTSNLSAGNNVSGSL